MYFTDPPQTARYGAGWVEVTVFNKIKQQNDVFIVISETAVEISATAAASISEDTEEPVSDVPEAIDEGIAPADTQPTAEEVPGTEPSAEMEQPSVEDAPVSEDVPVETPSEISSSSADAANAVES